GTYLDLAFYVVEGEVEVFFAGAGRGADRPRATPIFDAGRTGFIQRADLEAAAGAASPPADDPRSPSPTAPNPVPEGSGSHINFLASLDFELLPGQGQTLGPGELFGEIGAMSGWPQSATARTVRECRLLQIRVPALRLLKRVSKKLREKLDRLYRERALRQQLQSTPLFRGLDEDSLRRLEDAVELVSLGPGEILAREGDPVDALYLVRSGFLRLGQTYGDGEIVATYLSKGMTFGEAEILIADLGGYEMTASSVEYAELVKIPVDLVKRTMAADPQLVEDLWRGAVGRLKEVGASRGDPGRSAFVERALDSGLVQGNSILMIDLDACTRCDDCVRACADTHGGRPRFVREGERLENFLVPRSCYHCRDPVCLVGCPTGAIHRAGIGDVVAVDDGICIGCSTCANNCPYDAIVMHETGEEWPDDMVPTSLRGQDRLVASKCDLCAPLGHDPACVSNCPQGCAFRVGSLDEIRSLMKDR
ncbi:MAG: cyclic nucleotide-binding domain-containing protein, partial [Acidobacteriota bacterium]